MSDRSSFIRPDDFWRKVGVKAGQKVVHLGCGAGFYLIPVAKLVGKQGSVIGVDIMSNLLAEAEGRAQREGVDDIVHVVRADLDVLKGSRLPHGMADLVLVANILHQANPEAILGEARRIVSDEGRVVVVEWDVVSTPIGPPNSRRIAKEDVLAIAIRGGLKLQNDFLPSPYHYGLVLVPSN